MYDYNQALVLVRSKQKTEHGFSRVIQKFEKKFWRENQQLAQNHSKKAQSNESFLDISQMLGYKTQSASIYLLRKHMKKVWVSNQEQFKRNNSQLAIRQNESQLIGIPTMDTHDVQCGGGSVVVLQPI